MPRRPMDRYDSPTWVIGELIERAPYICGGHLLDPCSGNGWMAEWLRPRFDSVRTNDLDPLTPADSHLDARDPTLYGEPYLQPDWIVSNTPWNMAAPILWRCLEGARRGVALLLNLTFLEERPARDFLPARPPAQLIVLPRFSWDGSDKVPMTTAAWMIWPEQPQTSPAGPISVVPRSVLPPKEQRQGERRPPVVQLELAGGWSELRGEEGEHVHR